MPSLYRLLAENPRSFLVACAAAMLTSLSLRLAGPVAAVAPARLLPHLPRFFGEIDTGVVLLFVPLCALMFALLLEVARAVMRSLPAEARPLARGMPRWQE